MKIKHVYIEAFLPELTGGKCNQVAIGEATTVKPAISRAFGNLLKQIRTKGKGKGKRQGGKRISTIKATIVITTKELEGPIANDNQSA